MSVIGQPRDVRARHAARLIAEKVAQIVNGRPVPPEVWDATAPQDAAFCTTLDRWVETGAESDYAAIRARGEELTKAWGRAL
jgi:hypothetical protein